MEEERRMSRQMTVKFVTIHNEGDGGREDSSVSSSSRPSSATFSVSSGSDHSMMSTSVSPSPSIPSDVVVCEEIEEIVTTYRDNTDDDDDDDDDDDKSYNGPS